MDISNKCPVSENSNFLIRLIEEKDAADLFSVYGNKRVLPYFNSDNCHGDNFYCAKTECMQISNSKLSDDLFQ